MRGFLFVCILTVAACSQVASLRPMSREETKVLIAKLVETQRLKADWMAIPSCPFGHMADKSRKPQTPSTDCARNPNECLEKCNAKDADSCYSLAGLIQDHDKIENDVASVLYQRSCELGITSGCTNRASAIFEKDEIEGLKCAGRTFEKTCEMNDPWGCTMFGLALAEGIGLAKNVPEALNALSKACDIAIDKNGGACQRANELRDAIIRVQKLDSK